MVAFFYANAVTTSFLVVVLRLMLLTELEKQPQFDT